jgi:hypothetical protein
MPFSFQQMGWTTDGNPNRKKRREEKSRADELK